MSCNPKTLVPEPPYGPMIISGLKHRFPEFPVDFHVNFPRKTPWSLMGRRPGRHRLPGRRILYGGELGGPQIPKVITAGAQRPWPMVFHGPLGSESCCADENDEPMDEDDEDGHFFWVDRPISDQHKGWIGWTLFQDGKELRVDSCGNPGLTLFINAEFIG